MNINKNLILSVLFLSFVSCENFNKPKENKITMNNFEDLFLLGSTLKMNTLIRVDNQRDVPVAAAIYDNSACDPNAAPKYPGLPTVYDFGTVPSRSKSTVKSLPLASYPTNPSDWTGGRLVELYVRINLASCQRNSFLVSTSSDQIGYIWQVIRDSPTAFHNNFEIRRAVFIPPNME
ncbi:hypothetical protein [Leptospira mayottensis]|uniref:hypothetical protein n=1 Tax=Leptospira mayottensis TaxID=1137606 RepID=UPI0002BFE450|nr:hypothetical protein [Leptospira mayottensis]AXR62451.1 hypothetical protein DQM68_11670 [Leptospira mayottensis]AZQ02324.1 hypothetical protein LEP1GSC190_10040 [Leptospira mayottensis 200901116]TGM91274.1 hypothetical protein EHR03_18370 [Leptospira mayottensis]